MFSNAKNAMSNFFKDPNEKHIDRIKKDVPLIIKEYVTYLVEARETKSQFELMEKKFAEQARDYICAQYANTYPNLDKIFPEHLAIQMVLTPSVDVMHLVQYLTSLLCITDVDNADTRMSALSTYRDCCVIMTNKGLKFATTAQTLNDLNGRITDVEIVTEVVQSFIHSTLITCSKVAKKQYLERTKSEV